MRTDGAELVDAGKAGQRDPVAEGDVAGEGGIVGQHAMVADDTVVGDVHVGHDPVVVADAGDAATVAGTAADGGELEEGVAVADQQLGALAAVLLVLGIVAEGGVRMHDVVAAERGRAGDHRVRADPAAGADLHFGADDRERTDADVFGQFGPRVYDGGRVDVGAHSLPSAQRISALATVWPSTRASQAYRAMLRMVRLTVTSSSSWSPGPTMRLKRALSTFTR